ncbi:MAG TPA: hypothetical protein VK272_01895 [Solirubrobacteraceae bacterium]|nr:hypothetical protein [Solirubrobacteraceae bacterium]
MLGLALLAMGMLGTATATSAWATTLPEFSVETGFKGESGSTTFETLGRTSVVCKKSTNEGTAASKDSGTFHLAEKECASSGVKCTGRGDETGVILLSGGWHLVPSEGPMVLLSPSELEFSCSVLSAKIKGTILSVVGPVAAKAKEYDLEYNESAGTQELPEYENDSGTVVSTQLLASIGGGAFEETGVKAEEDKITTTKETELTKGSSFAVTNPLGRLQMEVGRPVDFIIHNDSLREETPIRIVFEQEPVRGPFEINVPNREKCERLRFPGWRIFSHVTCTVELKYPRGERGARALLKVEGPLGQIARSAVVGG